MSLIPVLLVVMALGVVIGSDPGVLGAWVGPEYRSAVLAVAGGMVAVPLTMIVIIAAAQIRLAALVRGAERIARGNLDVSVSGAGGGLDGRLARALNEIADRLATTTESATIDRLTGVANRASLIADLFSEVERAARYHRPLTVAFADIDNFKTVNDTYGHGAGDIVLQGVAQLMRANLRATDLIGRYGGEEFMIILPETDAEHGALLTEKLRTLVEKARFSVAGNPELSVTISIGVAGGLGQLGVDALIRDADAAMYSAKALGRNQTYVFDEPDEDARVPRAPVSVAGRARAIELGRAAREAALSALIETVANVPPHRGRASTRSATVAVAMARGLDLPEAEIERIRVGALLHDIGKIAVADEILDKPTSLTSTEWRAVIQHPRLGQVILEQASTLRDVVPIIVHHHERFGGHGYPFGLRGAEIPLGARIVAIADAYVAMVSDRPHRAAMDHGAAIEELQRHAGTQFDPELVELFCDLFIDAAPAPDPAPAGEPPRAIGPSARSAHGGHRSNGTRNGA